MSMSRESFLDNIFNEDDKDLFSEKEEQLLFTPRALTEFKAQMEVVGKDNDDLTEFDVLLDDLGGHHAERMNTILGNMSEHNFVKTYASLLGYKKPKFKSMDVEKVVPTSLTQVNITIHRQND